MMSRRKPAIVQNILQTRSSQEFPRKTSGKEKGDSGMLDAPVLWFLIVRVALQVPAVTFFGNAAFARECIKRRRKSLERRHLADVLCSLHCFP